MIQLFNLNNYVIDTNNYKNLLHDDIVSVFEKAVSKYVGAKYAVSFNSATSALFLALLNKRTVIQVPSIIPPVVLNAIITSGCKYNFCDNIEWVGNSYVLHNFGDYKIIDSAQKLEKNQFKKECNPADLMVFSFYPTKPIGSCDGGIIVSDDLDKINYFKELALNGMSYSSNNWERKIKFVGYKMYMNSIQAQIALNNFELYEHKLSKLSTIRNVYNKKLGYVNNSNHLYRIETQNRDEFVKLMKNDNISCGIHYEAAHLHPVYKIDDSKYPKSEKHSNVTVSIPFHEKLTEEQITFIVNKIKEYKKDV